LPASSLDTIQTLLDRPLEQRVREFKYRFAQSVVFGLPVLALERFGPALGWVEANRWVGVLQMLLAGWVVYVAAAGLMFEGILMLPRQISVDLLIATAAVVFYVISVVCVLYVLLLAKVWHQPMFHLSILLLIPWTGFRWWQLNRRDRSIQSSQ
jgi:cation transport ATPase